MNYTTDTQAPSTIAGQAWFANAGTVLTIAAGLAFLVVCMVLPLVGKAGIQTAHASQNHYAFLAVLIVSLVLAIAATAAKLLRRQVDHSPLPYLSLALLAMNLLLLVSLLGGLLSI